MRTASIAGALVACLALGAVAPTALAGEPVDIAQDLSGDIGGIGGIGPEGPEALPHEDTLEPGAEAERIARAQVIKRAKVWLTANGGRKVPYSQARKWLLHQQGAVGAAPLQAHRLNRGCVEPRFN